jgi:hypothetical protein
LLGIPHALRRPLIIYYVIDLMYLQDVPFQADTIVVVLEGRKEFVLLPRYPVNGVPLSAPGFKISELVTLQNDSMLPRAGSLQRLVHAYGDGKVLLLNPGSSVLIPAGMQHAARNVTRCVSLNTTHLRTTHEATLLALERTVFFYREQVDVGTKLGKGFALWVENVAGVFLRSATAARVGAGEVGYPEYSRKLGYVYLLASLVEKMKGMGCRQSSGMNAEWRSWLAAYLRDGARSV